MKNIDIEIDSRVTNYYFANVNTFTEYKKFEILVKFTNSRLSFSLFYSYFHFLFNLFPYFSIFRT